MVVVNVLATLPGWGIWMLAWVGCLSVGWFGCLLVYCATFVALRILLAVFCLFGVICWVALSVELVCWFG